MALRNTIDPLAATRQLQSWFSAREPQWRDIRILGLQVPKESGISAETLMFTLCWCDEVGTHEKPLVARVQPRRGGVWEHGDLRAEATVMRALSSSAVPVPRVLELVEDEHVLGAPFLLMEKVEGRVPRDDPPFTASGWVLELGKAEQARLYDNGLRTLAAIHALDPQTLGLQTLARHLNHDGTIRGALAHWRGFYRFAAERRLSATLDAAFEWLERHAPQDEQTPVLSWGDARLGNLLFDEALNVTAVLDWELAGLGSRAMDLGWWLFIMDHHTQGIGLPMPPGFPDRAAAVARYEMLSGQPVRDLPYWYAFAGLRIALAFMRAGHMMIAAGMLPADSPMPHSNPASQLLASALGLPPPDTRSETYIGNR